MYITAHKTSGAESIVSVLNYSCLPGKGIYVNCIVTTDDCITAAECSQEFLFLCGSNFICQRHRHATVLLQIAKLAYATKLYSEGLLQAGGQFFIVCQCDNSTSAAMFLHVLGFYKHDFITKEQELEDLVYAGLAEDVKKLQSSKTDFVNLMVNAEKENLTVFFHSTSDFDAPRTKHVSGKVGKFFPELLCNPTFRNNDTVFFH
jgi:hypothetical protein